MNAGSQRGGQPDVARHDQDEPPRPANPREIAPDARAIRVIVVAEDNAGQTARQAGNGVPRIGQAGGVGEQP
jgi:hypothetical protein